MLFDDMYLDIMELKVNFWIWDDIHNLSEVVNCW